MLAKKQVYFIYCLFGLFVHSKASFDCNESSFSACKEYAIGSDFPGTEKELELYCRSILDRLQCTVDFEEKCNKEELPRNTDRKLLEYFTGVCTKNHPFYSVLVDNLKCMESVLENDVEEWRMNFPSQETFRNYSKTLLDRGIDVFPGDEKKDIDLLMLLYPYVCRAQRMEKCGQAAVDTFVIFTEEMISILLDECCDKVGGHLQDIISVMNCEET